MEDLEFKLKIKKKKKIYSLIYKAINLHETSITYNANLNNYLTLKIKESIEDSLALITELPEWILNLEGLSGRKYRYFLNTLAKKINNPSYLEIGSWLGSTACSIMYNNKLSITCIDNWSQIFDDNNNPSETFNLNTKKSLNKFISFKIIRKDFRKIIYDKINETFNIFFYDGPHHYQDHYDAIKLAQKILKKEYILIIDDWNWLQVRNGTENALNDLDLEIISKIEIKTTQDDSKPLIQGKSSEWHNGYGFFVIKKKS